MVHLLTPTFTPETASWLAFGKTPRPAESSDSRISNSVSLAAVSFSPSGPIEPSTPRRPARPAAKNSNRRAEFSDDCGGEPVERFGIDDVGIDANRQHSVGRRALGSDSHRFTTSTHSDACSICGQNVDCVTPDAQRATGAGDHRDSGTHHNETEASTGEGIFENRKRTRATIQVIGSRKKRTFLPLSKPRDS